ncbi:MAG TPA: pseudouridine-5'-phosphate glycosidase, partial [Candidatus Cloacimonadota bacterium]|nr:pseudouridine-5'-phosphate glycosidase [Candidatus Cloacimonadota bacterium]
YSQESSIKLLYRADSAEEIVEVIRCKAELGMTGSVLVTNPIPSEFSVPIEEMDLIIQQAIAKANEAQIKGKRLTPFLLDAIQKMTNKDSLHANIALIKNNARLGAEIAYYNSKK